MRQGRVASWRSWAACVGACLGLAACGGGGGSEVAPGATEMEAPVRQVAWSQNQLELQHDVFNPNAPVPVRVALSLQSGARGYWFSYAFDRSLAHVTHTPRSSDDGLDFDVQFVTVPEGEAGVRSGTLSVTLCEDELCNRPVSGSPFVLPLRLEVGYFAQAESGVTAWAPAQTAVLAHDVVSAGYSAALDAVITASAVPEPMLRVHHLQTGLTRQFPLATAPTGLSVGADGLQAAVGHDAAVSLIDLRPGGAQTVQRWAVSLPVGAVALAGQRIVALGGQAFAMNELVGIDTATGAATRLGGVAAVYGAAQMIRHPVGDRVYLADRGLSPDDVFRLDLAADAAASLLSDSRYHGEYAFCARLAASPDGRRLYTGCGAVLSLDAALANDMTYAGQLALSPRDPALLDTYAAASLSVAPDSANVALLEQRRLACDERASTLYDCHSRLATYDTSTLARRSLVGLPVHVRGNDRLRQWGRHVFHRADGSLLVLAEVRTRGEALPTWLLHQKPQ